MVSNRQYKRPESVLVVIYDNQGRFLLMNRLDDALFWQSVTGSLDWGENKLSAAYREVQEETGLDLLTLECQMVDHGITNRYEIFAKSRHKYAPDTTHNTEYVFSVKVPINLDINLTEHFEFKWLDKQAALRLASSDTNRDAIANILC